MRKCDSLKSYIGYFQSQLAKVPNCVEASLHLHSSTGCKSLTSLYKHLMKHIVTQMIEVLSRAQPYI